MATQTPSSSTSEDTKKSKRDNSSSSEEDEKIITSSPSSSSIPRWKYEVFLSFYGKDTRTSFTDHLYVDLKRNGILVFRDDEALQRGEYISQALLKAIQDSQYAIVIFSANYAFSRWCLLELAEIVEWEEKKTLTILPIFYHVDPSDVRNQSGSFAEAFTAHEKDPNIDKKDMDMWKNALKKTGSIAGWHIHDRYESTIIQDISRHISHELNSRLSSHDYDKLVAIDSKVDKMMELLDMGSDDVRFVGIHGMGGVGKTTLAKIIRDRLSCQFEGSSFISCIGEKSRDLASLQKKLLSMIMQEKTPVWDHQEGIDMIKRRMRNKKVFIVLDDVDSEKQLVALAGSQYDWFGPGSRVIITCRDSHLLKTHGVNDIYKVEQLQTDEALQLFSLSAFKKTHPTKNYKDLSMDFVNYAQGLPLALKVLGSFLFGRTTVAWRTARDQLEAIPNKEIMNILQISFKGLEDMQKELFLDMACLFQRHRLDNIFLQTLESFGYYPGINIDVLVDKSLLTISDGWLSMHDLLKELGREIVRRECPAEPGRRSRLFRHEDIFHVLKNDTGTDAIEGMVLDFCPETKKRFNSQALSNMKNLRVLEIDPGIHSSIEWCGDPLKSLPTNKLRFLVLAKYAWKSLPSSFQPKNLTVLRMTGSRIKQLWKGSMVLENLKCFDLSFSENLIETPDLTGAPNLEKIFLPGCRSLCKVHPSIGFLKRLKKLVLSSSECLRRLPDKFCLESLEILSLKCSRLEKLPDFLGDMTSLKALYFSEPTKTNLPSSFMSLSGLRHLELTDCKNISFFPSFICSLSSLEKLWLFGWSRLEKFPDLSRLECLMEFMAMGTAITGIPSVNLIPKSIRSFLLEGRKRMPCKSRDLPILVNDSSLPKQSSASTNDSGSLVEYQMQGKYVVNAMYIDIDSQGENILDMASGGVWNSLFEYDDAGIYGWSLGCGIPEWVDNTSNGSSVKIDLDGNTNMKGMGCAVFFVCDSYQFPSPEGYSISSLFKESFFNSSNVRFTLCFETDEGSSTSCYWVSFPSLDVCFGKLPIGFWAYIPAPRFLKCWKSKNLDKQSFIKISITAKMVSYKSSTCRPPINVELKVMECGVHLVSPNDANSHFYNSIAPHLGLGSSNLDFYRRFQFSLHGAFGTQPLKIIDDDEVF